MSFKRVWLNPVDSHDNGWIKYGLKKDEYNCYDATLRFADCSRSIDFATTVETKKQRKNTLRKLRIFQKAINEMIDAIQEIDN